MPDAPLAILLEIEGTLVDTSRARARVVERFASDIASARDQVDRDLIALRMEDALLADLSQSIEVIEGGMDALDRLMAIGSVAIVSTSARRVIDLVMRTIGREYAASVVVAGDDAHAAKPSPAPYIDAVERMSARQRMPAPHFVAIESSDAGVRSARDAGIPVIAVGFQPGAPVAAVKSIAAIDGRILRSLVATPANAA